MNPEVFAGLEQQPAKQEIADLCAKVLRAYNIMPPTPANYSSPLVAIVMAHHADIRIQLLSSEDYDLFGALVEKARQKFYQLSCPARENASVVHALERCRVRPEDK